MNDDYDHDGRKKASKKKSKSNKKISYSKALQSANPFKWYKGKSKESGTRVMIIPPSMYKKLGIKKVSKKEYLSKASLWAKKKKSRKSGSKSGKKVKKSGSKSGKKVTRSKSGRKVKKTKSGKKSGSKSGKKVTRSKSGRKVKKTTGKKSGKKEKFIHEGCVRQYTKKYTSRLSPPLPANKCSNILALGNDNRYWESKRASNGIYRWVRAE